jgi:pyruvate kinase
VVRSALTAKDKRDLAFAIELEADFIALSFVRRPEDLHEARRLIVQRGGDQLLVAKIETRAAIDNLDEVLAAADAAMVARGDLGVELPPERVPIEQKRIIDACNAVGKPVITATQMLESMRHASRPTRAEASDVANAVLDGSWAVMLSAETATGDYPVESVQMLERIAHEAEKMMLRGQRRRAPRGVAGGISDAIADAGVLVAFEVGARALVALTRSGATACQVARCVPHLPTFAYTASPRTWTRMTLYRGITPRRLKEQGSLEQAIARVERDLRRQRNVNKGDLFVLLGGAPDEPQGGTSRLVVQLVR